MCGIAGIVGPDTKAALPRVRAMLRALAHRGPDGEGLLERPGIVLGHRRLSIIDLSAAASQPMTSADGQRHLILNGEIYNYLELRAELEALGCRFRTRSDTEVLLEAWRVWGRETLARIVGMFAFALLDAKREVLVIARDPFAIKPLYYVQVNGALAFASEIPPLLEFPGVSRRVDASAVSDFLTRGVNNHGGRTMFVDVRELPGAHWAEVRLDSPVVSPVRYWQPPDSQRFDLSFEDAATRLRELIEESVRFHLRSDVPIGTLLSGGQDSSSVLTMSRHVLGPGAPLQTFSYRGEAGETDEGRWIEAARSAAGAIGHDIRITPEEWARDLPELIRSQGEPFSSPVIYAQRRLFQRAAECGVKVVLDGQGSDEYLAGYNRFYPGRLAALLYQHRYLEFARTAAGIAGDGAGWRPALSSLALRWPVLRSGRGPEPEAPLLAKDWCRDTGGQVSVLARPRGPGPLRQMLGASLSQPSIPWLMRYADRSAMAFSIENRLPFLNTRIVEFALGLPEEYAIGRDGLVKQLLRAAMRPHVPEVIRARRDKIGFDVPVETWLPRTPGLAAELERAAALPVIRRDAVMPLLQAVRAGRVLPRRQAFEAWRCVTLAAWSREFDVVYS